MITRAQLVAWETAFGPLTEEERWLLTEPSGLLAPLERQSQFILKWYMDPAACPACQQLVPPRQAHGKPLDYRTVSEDVFTCPHCGRRLLRTVALFGPCFWMLAEPLPPLEQGAGQ
jgi:predicted RNA-binding Zn-ribbon protein involved in translation (DUF1610 family)